MPIYDEPLLTGQPPLSGNLWVPRGLQLNEGSTVIAYSYLNTTVY